MQKKCEGTKGITLVALVVTIIVLMILSGITLTLVLGQNGVITKAQQAKELSTNAETATTDGLNNLYNEITIATNEKTTQTTVLTATGKILSNTDNTQIKDDNGNIVTIPAGFKIASESATKQEYGIVIEDNDGNQFVWIPVATISDYKRTNFGTQYGNYNSDYSDVMPTDEQTSVDIYHGYYIGRYEAGDSVSTTNKTLRASGNSVTNRVSIKKGQTPYSWVTSDQAKTLSEGMTTTEHYKATTKLCSSYAWDTAINFIQKTVANYATSSNQGNYSNTTFTYTDITGANQVKASSSGILIPTGQTTPVCNIYDMGGNDVEWTTGLYQSQYPCIRGGTYNDSYTSWPASSMSYGAVKAPYGYVGFRVTLYM